MVLNPPKDASAPSSVKEGQKVVTTQIPAGTVVVKESVAPTPESPAIERETTTYAAPSEMVETQTTSEISVSPPRAPDQTVALRKVDNQARQPMLYASIICIIIAGIFIYRGKVDAATLSGSVAAALALLWYALSSPLFMSAAFGIVVLGVGFFIWNKQKKASKTEEALRRTVQTIEELRVDQPAMAKEIEEYQSSNLDTEHKGLIQALVPTISEKYIREQLAKRSIPS